MNSKVYELTSIRFSHYVEKVRWTLDRFQIPYIEHPLMPVTHFFVTPFVIGLSGMPDKNSTRFSTPLMKTPEGTIILKSSKIMKYICDHHAEESTHLFPSEEVFKLDEHYNNFLAPHVRRVVYFNILPNQKLMFKLADKNVGLLQATAFKTLFPICKRWILGGLAINKERVEKGKSYIYKEFEEVEKRLRDGRPFLTGDRFTAADISFACLGGAVCLPTPKEGYAGKLPELEEVNQDLSSLSRELRETVAGKWLFKLFKEERGKRVIPGKPALI